MKRLMVLIGWMLAGVASARGNDDPLSQVGAAMTERAQAFCGSLDEPSRALAMRKFDDPARLDWHNIPKPVRKGLQLREMNAQQRERCHALLQAALSESGYEKAVRIMALENNLREGEKGLTGSPLRDPDRYFLTIFGQPATTGQWGWSFEGHHFSLNFVILDGKVVADTPSFWGANPALVHLLVPGGPPVGTRTLADEEQLALDLVQELTAEQRQQAVIADKAPADYRFAGAPQVPQTVPEGIPGNQLTPGQQRQLLGLLRAYNSHLAPPLAAERMAEIESRGLDRVFFAWAGATQPGVGHYYRVEGPTFVLELVNFQSDPAGNPANHIHSVWRSLTGDFGVPRQVAAE